MTTNDFCEMIDRTGKFVYAQDGCVYYSGHFVCTEGRLRDFLKTAEPTVIARTAILIIDFLEACERAYDDQHIDRI